MHASLASLYPQHLATLRERADRALEIGGFDHLLIAASLPLRKFLDDQDYPFVVSPQFKHWLPLTDAPGSWIIHTPGQRPKLVFVQPRDYWHVVPQAPSGYWVEHFDIVTVRDATAALAELPGGRRAVIAPACAGDPLTAPVTPVIRPDLIDLTAETVQLADLPRFPGMTAGSGRCCWRNSCCG